MGRGRKHGLQIVKNVVRALHSLNEVTALWESETKARRNPKWTRTNSEKHMVPAKDYVFVIYARPDLSFRSPIDLSLLKTLSSTQLYTPRWGCWMGGVNDRFVAGQPRAARAFGRRFDLLANVSDLPLDHAQRQNGLHAELFARYALEVAGIRPVHAPTPCAVRVRINGEEKARDCDLATHNRICHDRVCIVANAHPQNACGSYGAALVAS